MEADAAEPEQEPAAERPKRLAYSLSRRLEGGDFNLFRTEQSVTVAVRHFAVNTAGPS